MNFRATIPTAVSIIIGLGQALCVADEPIDFNRDIRPILSDNCFFCHGPDPKNREADLRLDTRGGLFGKGSELAIVKSKSPAESELWARVTSKDPDLRMPPVDSRKSLTEKQLKLIRRWIESGANWQGHWAYSPVRRPAIPPTSDRQWPVNDIDRLLLAPMEKANVKPSSPADSITLVRRLYFDLLGLPPTQREIKAYTESKKTNAYEMLVDQLLSSKHFGERMAVHWLDLVRYADTVGYHGDQDHAISPYRDYVIRAFNDNLPFDRFTIEQLAGDLLPKPSNTQLIATGYNRVLQTSHEGGVQKKEYLTKYSADRVRNVSSVWLGATLGCAECHNHKYDPYTQRDFYSLAAFFADVDDNQTFSGSNTLPTKRLPEIVALSPVAQDHHDQLTKRLAKLSAQIKIAEAKQPPAEVQKLKLELASINKQIQQLNTQKQRTMVTAAIKPRPIRVLNRGDWQDTSGPIVGPAVPEFLGKLPGSRRATRLDLARWLVDRNNPLTARVFVNRLWKILFGVGISTRLDDLGSQGEPPANPQLLDWLAAEFMDSGWDVKHVTKLIVMSRGYRQSSAPRDDLAGDSGNRLLVRQGRFRLDAEFIRDNALAVSGLLVRRIGGRPAKPYQPAGYYQHLNFPKRSYAHDNDDNQYRRGVYMHWQRVFLHPMLKAFDAPSREECTAERPRSNTPLAALVLLNDPTMVESARALATRILREGGDKDQTRLRWAWREALSREPTADELRLMQLLLQADMSDFRKHPAEAKKLIAIGNSQPPKDIEPATLASWTSVARAIFNLHEFITRN